MWTLYTGAQVLAEVSREVTVWFQVDRLLMLVCTPMTKDQRRSREQGISCVATSKGLAVKEETSPWRSVAYYHCFCRNVAT